jgi:hypothetical protein
MPLSTAMQDPMPIQEFTSDQDPVPTQKSIMESIVMRHIQQSVSFQNIRELHELEQEN